MANRLAQQPSPRIAVFGSSENRAEFEGDSAWSYVDGGNIALGGEEEDGEDDEESDD